MNNRFFNFYYDYIVCRTKSIVSIDRSIREQISSFRYRYMLNRKRDNAMLHNYSLECRTLVLYVDWFVKCMIHKGMLHQFQAMEISIKNISIFISMKLTIFCLAKTATRTKVKFVLVLVGFYASTMSQGENGGAVIRKCDVPKASESQMKNVLQYFFPCIFYCAHSA